MKKQSYSFPSVYEATGTSLSFVSKDLINGLQLYDAQDQSYIIGNLALNEGVSPNKLVNSSPYELDYQLLLQAGLLLANHNNNRPLAITTGFPFSTFQVYKDIAKETILKLNSIEYNLGTFKNEGRISLKTNIQQVEILPEMIGNIIGLRVGEAQATGNFFVVSLGYGTCEAVLSTENGIVHRTASSINGMQYAVDLFMRSLGSKYYLGLKTEKQLDVSFRNDHIILDRQKINIVDLRRRILERYYIDIISNGLRKSFTDSDFERADKIYLTGGGALFPELIEMFEKEFKQIAKVEVVKNPLTLTSEGYSLNSIMLTNGDESTAVGLDIGNANTVLTQYENEEIENEIETKEKIVVPKIIEEQEEEKKNESLEQQEITEVPENELSKEGKEEDVIVEVDNIEVLIVSKNEEIITEQQDTTEIESVKLEDVIVDIDKEEVIIESKNEEIVQDLLVDSEIGSTKEEEIVVEIKNPEPPLESEETKQSAIERKIKEYLAKKELENAFADEEALNTNKSITLEEPKIDKTTEAEKVDEIEEKEILKVVETIKEEIIDEEFENNKINNLANHDYEPDFS